MAPGYPAYSRPLLAPLPERKRHPARRAGIVALVVAVLPACAGGAIFATRLVNQAGSAQAGSSSGAGAVVYQNSFSSTSDTSGWAQDPHCFTGIDGYHVADSYVCLVPAGEQANFSLSVNIKQLSGPTTQGYGIIFRHTGSGSDYSFFIDSNSKWLFTKCVGTDCSDGADFTANAAIVAASTRPTP